MHKTPEIELDGYRLLIFKHKTNKRLFLERPYYWVDRIILIDETEDRGIVMDLYRCTVIFYLVQFLIEYEIMLV